MAIEMIVNKNTSFNHYKNKNNFNSKIELSMELIDFANKRKDNPAAARAILHSIQYIVHDLRNIYSVLLGQYELELLKEVRNEHTEPLGSRQRHPVQREKSAATAPAHQ